MKEETILQEEAGAVYVAHSKAKIEHFVAAKAENRHHNVGLEGNPDWNQQ